jgi:thiol-disulfide isomerase/thioredoxin
MKQTILLLLGLLLLFFGCKQGQKPPVDPADAVDTLVETTAPFVRPDVPALITDPELRFRFLVEHYWDRFDFADTTYVPTPDITEQAWVDYIDLLRRAPLDRSQAAIRALMLRSASGSKTIFLYLIEMADKYLFEPNSPARNEELYIPVLEVVTQSDALTSTEKMLSQNRLQKAYKNRIHTRAIDFRYTTRDGKTGTLYRLRSEYLLLFFNEPGCPSCKEHIAGMRQSPVLNHLEATRRLKILSIYADKNVDEWEKHYANYPSQWINGYDGSLTIENDYDIKAIPTLYLLDGNKMVLLKDATLGEIEDYLNYRES